MDVEAAPQPAPEQPPKRVAVTTSDPHRSLKRGLRVAFGDMAERHGLWMAPDAVAKPPTAREMLKIFGFPDWDAAARALDERGGTAHLGARLTQRKVKLCTDRTLQFKRLAQPWSRDKWLSVLGVLFGDPGVVFFVSGSYMCRYPILGWRMLTPLPRRVLAPPAEWDAIADGHEEVCVIRRSRGESSADEPSR